MTDIQTWDTLAAEILRLTDERDAFVKRHREQVEVIRQRIDAGGLTPDERRLLEDLHFETSYDRR